MNATEKIFALALASNDYPEQHFQQVYRQIADMGQVQFSQIYLIPCRDGVGAEYWNSACLLKSKLTVEAMILILKKMEQDAGRIRPSHQISLDIDLIAWGTDLEHMQFNLSKLPIATDVKIPMREIWTHPFFEKQQHNFQIVTCAILSNI